MGFAQLRPGPQISCAAHCTGRALRVFSALHRLAAQVSRALATAGLLLCSACPLDCLVLPKPFFCQVFSIDFITTDVSKDLGSA